MAESPKRARADAVEERRPRRDPRAEPDSRPPPRPPEERRYKTPPESEMRTAVAKRVTPSPSTLEDFGSIATPRSFDSTAAREAAGATEAAGLRRQIATLQKELSAARAELGREQEDRANDAEKMGTLLDRVATEDAVAQSLRDDLARERGFVEELRLTVQDKYAECNELKKRMSELEENLTAKELDEATERHVHNQDAERTEQKLADLAKQFESLRQKKEALEAELEKTSGALKVAHLKAFSAQRQLESWKTESSRTLEHTRAEQNARIATLATEHAKAVAGLGMALKALEAAEAALAQQPSPPPPELEAPANAPAAHAPPSARSAPTKPAMPAVLPRKLPASTPSLEVAELDIRPEDLVDELISGGD